MRITALIQAHMGSTRLPGKVLLDICGSSMLARVVRRVQRATLLDDVRVATTTNDADSVIEKECQRLGVGCVRGPDNDVLARLHQAATDLAADVIVRITSDCPLADPLEIDRVVHALRLHHADYASNFLIRTLPRGLEAEALTYDALNRAHLEAERPYEREHVTPYVYTHPERFRLVPVVVGPDVHDLRWTVDEPDDLTLVRALYARGAANMGWRQIAELFRLEPNLRGINAHVIQKAMTDG